MINLEMETPISNNTSREELANNTHIHKGNVWEIINEMCSILKWRARLHDYTKYHEGSVDNTVTEQPDEDFYKMLICNEENGWWKMHQQTERHHLSKPEFIQDDVNLFDIMEMIADGISAGFGRNGHYENYYKDFDKDLLAKAFQNTITQLVEKVEITK